MKRFESKITNSAPFREILTSLRHRRQIAVRGPVGSGAALIISSLVKRLDTAALVICPGIQYGEEFTEDAAFLHADIACYFPPLESKDDFKAGHGEAAANDPASRSRLRVLKHLRFGAEENQHKSEEWFEPRSGTRMICASINAVLQPVSPPAELSGQSLTLHEGLHSSPTGTVEWLVDHGFISMPQVEFPGHYSLRGGILDIFPFGTDTPVRIEFFGDEIDSIRTFDPRLQLSNKRITQCLIISSPKNDSGDRSLAEEKANILSYLPPGAPVFVLEPDHTWNRADELAGTKRGAGAFFTSEDIREQIDENHPAVLFCPADEPLEPDAIDISFGQRDVFGIDISGMADELQRISSAKDTYILCAQEAEEERLKSLLEDEGVDPDRFYYEKGRLNHGVIFPDESLALIPHHRLFGRYRQRRVLRQGEQARPIASIEQLRPGDYVVHIEYGIGRFRGTQILESNGRAREHIEIEFDESAKLYVPADRLELVHRYIGIGEKTPKLSKIRGVSWKRKRHKAEKAAEDLAAELLNLQAIRNSKTGLEHPEDDSWQKQFEAEFPYEETEDQLRAIEEIKKDMEAGRPMDRLICGDVGYGKTELAMRGAFKCVMGGRQTALVAPTTVLAQQHRRTFRERMADYPVRIEMLSRFVTPSKADQLLGELEAGKIDIIIGTHRLLQKDVQFSDLGLLIVDEEQRFGVKDKEKLKKMRSAVDILTLTATPIPRTLHMSMMGLRDISALQTPPLSRQAVETHVSRYDPELVRHAILRELNREGQVFFVHNRVKSISSAARRVKSLVPEARVTVGHGQMREQKLAETMEAFCEGRKDVLVSTTIIENGLDIPNANTLIIDRAELLGLAEMHQLRGRVGRYIHRAYAYFLTPEDRPVTPEARKRLDTIRRYSDLGAGFDIALRDLELRGAGNILGPQQSGHIAAVGYSLYCRMLAWAQQKLKGEKIQPSITTNVDLGMEAYLDEDCMPSLQHRIEIYRRIAGACSNEEVEKIATELRDRFGPLPKPAQNLILEAKIRINGFRAGIDSITRKDGRIVLGIGDIERFRSHFSHASVSPKIIREEYALLEAPGSTLQEHKAAVQILELLKGT